MILKGLFPILNIYHHLPQMIGSKIPFVELHISNIFSREDFRKESFLTDKAIGIISGFGISSYSLALEGIIGYLSSKN